MNLDFRESLTNNFKYLNVLCVLYTTFLLVASLIVHKMINIGPYTISASTLIFPFTYFLGDVIAEVYGYKISRQLIWSAFMAMFIFDLLVPLIIHLPSPTDWKLQSSYNDVISPLPRIFMGDFLGLNIGAFINVYLITKWKGILKGRIFWLRSLGATSIGEAMFNIVAFTIIFLGVIPINELLQAMILSYIFKLVFAVVSVYPACLLVIYLKKTENVDVYDYNTDFNPFKLEV